MDLVLTNQEGNNITTSHIVAEIFGKNHADVLRDIRNLHCSKEFHESNFAECLNIIQLETGNSRQKFYEITKDGFSFLVMGYHGKKAGAFKEKFLNEFNKREALLKDDDYIVARSQEILGRRLKALEQQIKQRDERLQLQEQVIKTNTPKAEYYDEVLQSDSTYTTNQIAKELGMAAPTLNKKLKQMGVQYKQSGVWMLYQRYQNKGYQKPRTHPYTGSDGEIHTKTYFVWTEQGRLFVHGFFKQKEGAEAKQMKL